MTNHEFTYVINGYQFRPEDADTIGVRLDFVTDITEAELTVDALKINTVAYREIMQHVNNGPGLFEGVPLNILIGTQSMEYYIDLTDGAVFYDDHIECKISKRWATDSFKQRASGLTFEFLNSVKPITGIFDVPYVIISPEQVVTYIVLQLTLFQMTVALIQSIRDLATIITAGTIEASVPVATIPPIPPPGSIASLIIKIAAQTIYIFALIAAIIKLGKQIVEIVFPKVRNLKASKVKALIEQACAHLGYSFQSTLLDGETPLTLLPVPLLESNPSIFDILVGNSTVYFNKGYPTANDSVQTLMDLLEQMMLWGNARLRVIGKKVYLEKREYWYTQSSIPVINTLNIQEERQNAHRFNFEDSWKRYIFGYQTDETDINTLDRITGLKTEYQTDIVNSVNADLVRIPGGVKRVDMQFSLAARKNSLNFIEKSVASLAQQIDGVVNALGGSSNLYGKVIGRIGVMQISQQHFEKTKLMWTIGGKQPADYINHIGADSVYLRHHKSNQVKENFKQISTSSIPFAPDQFDALNGNNVLQDQNGELLEIRTFEWYDGQARADVEYSIKSGKANNTKTIKVA